MVASSLSQSKAVTTLSDFSGSGFTGWHPSSSLLRFGTSQTVCVPSANFVPATGLAVHRVRPPSPGADDHSTPSLRLSAPSAVHDGRVQLSMGVTVCGSTGVLGVVPLQTIQCETTAWFPPLLTGDAYATPACGCSMTLFHRLPALMTSTSQ